MPEWLQDFAPILILLVVIAVTVSQGPGRLLPSQSLAAGKSEIAVTSPSLVMTPSSTLRV